jgi:NADH-quinone oxidoreductase subunit C
MDAPTLIAVLQEAVPGAQLEAARTFDLHGTFYAPRDLVVDLSRALRDRPELAFDVLPELTAVDFHPREPRYEVEYILLSTTRRARARMKVRLQGEDPHVATVSGVWPAANWLEREVWDMFGIAFDGHPDPRRLLMPEDWDGFPLRKDYPVQIRKATSSAEPLQVTEQEFRANVMKDRLTRPR